MGWGTQFVPLPAAPTPHTNGQSTPIFSGALALRPQASFLNNGWIYVATDQGGTPYYSNGTSWIPAGMPATPATATISTSLTTPKVIGGTGTGSTLTISATSGVGATEAILFVGGNNGATEFGRFIHGGYLGLGTASPASRIHLVGSDAYEGVTVESSATTGPRIQLHSTGGGGNWQMLSTSSADGPAADSLAFYSNTMGAFAFTIDNTGTPTFAVIGAITPGGPVAQTTYMPVKDGAGNLYWIPLYQ